MDPSSSSEEGEAILDEFLADFLKQGIDDHSLQKIKNQGEAMKTYESIQLINRMMNLAMYANMGHPDLYWDEFDRKSSIVTDQVMDWANRLLRPEKSSVLHYQKEIS
jgi:predicted Zn-dependent peptidase